MEASAIIMWFLYLGLLFFWKEDMKRHILSAGRTWAPPVSRWRLWKVKSPPALVQTAWQFRAGHLGESLAGRGELQCVLA